MAIKTAEASVSVSCDECHTIATVRAEQFEFEQVGAEERQMGAEITYEATVEFSCSGCGSTIVIKHLFSEYPPGCPNYAETTARGATVVSDTM